MLLISHFSRVFVLPDIKFASSLNNTCLLAVWTICALAVWILVLADWTLVLAVWTLDIGARRLDTCARSLDMVGYSFGSVLACVLSLDISLCMCA